MTIVEGNIIDKPVDEAQRYLEESRQLSLSLLYWLQRKRRVWMAGWVTQGCTYDLT